MAVYILSTFAHSIDYTVYGEAPPNAIPPVRRVITIRGGADIASETNPFGVASKTEEGRVLWTPAGIVTSVSDADYELLKGISAFRVHMDAGMLKLVNANVQNDHDKVERETRSMSKDEHGVMNASNVAKRVKSQSASKAKISTGSDALSDGRL